MGLITSYWATDGMILMIITTVLAYAYMTRKFLYWKKRGVMEISPTPFTGNFTDCIRMKKSPGAFIKDLYDRSANLPYMGFYILDRPFFMPRDPELIKLMMTQDFEYFKDRYSTAHDSLGAPNVFFLKSPGWKPVRSKLTPVFTSGKLKKMFQLMLKVGEDLKTHLNSIILDEGRIVDVKDLSDRYSTDIIGSTIFGLDVNCLNNPEAEFRWCGFQLLNFTIWRSIELSSLWFAPHLGKLFGFRFFTEKMSEVMRRIVQDTMANRERSGNKRGDLIDRLMEIKVAEANSPDKDIFDFDGDNLVAQAAAFFSAGFETVSNAISFMLYELALAPEIQTRLREEIQSVLKDNNGEITYDMMTKLPYLDMVVAETLRKYPSLPFLDRVVIADYKIPGSDLVLEKGTPIYIPKIGLHYDPQYFPDPEAFDPERFNEENKKNQTPFAYIPFGGGPRGCIGMRFGQLECKLAAVQILSDYELLQCESTLFPMKYVARAVLMKAEGGVKLKIRKLVTANDRG